MKLATWNVNSIRARKDRLFAWLEAHSPEVVCLQETKVVDEDFPGEELRELGYHSHFHGQKTYNGVAILSRSEASDVVTGFADGDVEDQARVIAATVGGVRVICVYVPNGKEVGSDKYTYKLAWMERLRRYLDRNLKAEDEVVLCGDFNVAPEDRDVWDPARWKDQVLCSDQERSALRRIVDWGFVDSFRMLHEEPGMYSWWDYRQLAFPKKRGLRIDHVYVTRTVAERCDESFIDREERKGKLPSDHAPVVIRLRDA